jgi:hypothetical protein
VFVYGQGISQRREREHLVTNGCQHKTSGWGSCGRKITEHACRQCVVSNYEGWKPVCEAAMIRSGRVQAQASSPKHYQRRCVQRGGPVHPSGYSHSPRNRSVICYHCSCPDGMYPRLVFARLRCTQMDASAAGGLDLDMQNGQLRCPRLRQSRQMTEAALRAIRCSSGVASSRGRRASQ